MTPNKKLHYITCSIVFFGILIFLLIIAFIVFSIIGLINKSDACDESDLWLYSIVSLLLLLKIRNTMKVFTKNTNNIMIVIELLTLIGMVGWGFREFFYVDCTDKINDTLLYKTCFLYWVVNFILLVILLLVIPGSCVVAPEVEYNLNEEFNIA